MLQPKVYHSVKLKVKAIQYTGYNAAAIMHFAGESIQLDNALHIKTKEGDMLVAVGDYVVKEPFPTKDRNFYPVKQAIFEKRYCSEDHSSKTRLFIGIAIILGVAIMSFVAGVMFSIWYTQH